MDESLSRHVTRSALSVAARRARTAAGVVEALGCLCVARVMVAALPFRRIAAALGAAETASPVEVSPRDVERARRVRDVIRHACRWLPLRPSCLVKSVAAMYMLRRRGVEGTLYLGVAVEPGQTLRAHAWVRCGRDFVVGGRDHAQFAEVTSFTRKMC